MRFKIVLFMTYCFFLSSQAQQHFPGGVSGAESWYIVNHPEVDQSYFRNHSAEHIRIKTCEEFSAERSFFNFNHSLNTHPLCLYYFAPLENTISRNVFFVGQHDPRVELSNLTTSWDEALDLSEPVVENRFDISIREIQVDNQIFSEYEQPKETINFYNWNIYQTERKYKSYGYRGETKFSIGKRFSNPDDGIEADYYYGNFPEFISFPFELTANQRNRVESYLALKYGVTLEKKQSYRNSKNTVFWKKENNSLFGNRIFGIGKDDISGLNQLISESVHNKNFLVTAVGGFSYMTNLEKQEEVTILDNHFIVFGDNISKDGIVKNQNNFGVHRIHKIWLSQNTGSESSGFSMWFKANLEAMTLWQNLIESPSLKIWMLHDKYVTNQDYSDFNSQYVKYYEVSHTEDDGKQAFFNKIYFDTDVNIYDQFTFGIGPQMIVQVQFDQVDCDPGKKDVDANVVISGGVAPYEIGIVNLNQSFSFGYGTNNNVSSFNAPQPDTYLIRVHDSDGNYAETTIHIAIPQISVDLGPDTVLNASQPEVVLDAGQNVNDPDATYQWYLDGVLLDHTEPVLTASEPGKYTVIVTAGNRICQEDDSIIISRNFTGVLSTGEFDCEDSSGFIDISLTGGMDLFTVNISGGEPPINGVFNTENFTFNNVPFGTYTVTVTDSVGEVFEDSITLVDPIGINIDLLSQLNEDHCQQLTWSTPLPYPAFLCLDITYPQYIPYSQIFNAYSFISNATNVSYEWLMNGIPFSVSNLIEIDHDFPHQNLDEWMCFDSDLHELTLVMTNLDTGCSVSETVIVLKGFCIRELPSNSPIARANSENEFVNNELEEDVLGIDIKTRVYPNPSDSGGKFYYEVYSSDFSEILEGTVGLYTVTGALIEQKNISGKPNYTFSYELHTSGVYFIRTQANGTLLTDKIIIR